MRKMKIKMMIGGIGSFIRGGNQYSEIRTGGSDSARYCYSVWLRHLVIAKNNGLNPYPRVIAELGPGDSIGVGLAALISGCEHYYALDIVEHANIARNIKIFDELVMLFKERSAIPGEDEFPKLKPYLDRYDFPADILNDDRLVQALDASRIANIRSAVTDPDIYRGIVSYAAPWYDTDIIEEETVDMIFSQAVLEHVDDLHGIYRSMRSWLKPKGYMSHQIDFKCHGTAEEWNGHWVYSDLVWKVIKGKRPYLLNREPHSAHIALLDKEGFEIVYDGRMTSESHITASDLASRFRNISFKDLTTSNAFIQAVKPH